MVPDAHELHRVDNLDHPLGDGRVKQWRRRHDEERWIAAGTLEGERSFRRLTGHADMPVLVAAIANLTNPVAGTPINYAQTARASSGSHQLQHEAKTFSSRRVVMGGSEPRFQEVIVDLTDAGVRYGPGRYGAERVQFASGGRVRPGRDSQLDDADLRIIDTLVRDGWTNSREMVGVSGLTEETVATRIRNLIERNIVGITAIFDWDAAGYHWDLWLAVECEGGPLGPTVKALAELDQVAAIYTVFGPTDLVVHVLCTDRAELLDFLSSTLTQIEGIRKTDVILSLDTVKYFHQFAWVPVEPQPLRFPDPVVELSDIDRASFDRGRTQRSHLEP